MSTEYSTFHLLLLISVWVIILASNIYGHNNKIHHILFINSYHPGYAWSDDIEQGISEQIQKSGKPVDISHEYLDSRRFPQGDHVNNLVSTINKKYSSYHPDVIIVSDNAAFDFAIKYRNHVFAGQPIVFCGYNNFNPAILNGIRNITGINEEINFEKAIDIAVNIHRNARTLAIILSTGNITDKINCEQIELSLLPVLREKYDIIVIKDASLKEIQNRLAALPKGALLFIFGQARDLNNGQQLSATESAQHIAALSKFPSYGIWDFQLGTGVIGGHIINGYDQGRKAAEIALSILGGTPADSIPVTMDTPATDFFDYPAMQRFGIKQTDLPPGSIILHKPITIWTHHRNVIVSILIIIFALILFIAVLLYQNLRLKRTEEALQASERKYRNIFENSTDGIFQTGIHGEILSINPAMAKNLGYVSVDDLIAATGGNTKELYKDPAEYEKLRQLLIEKGSVTNYVVRMRKKDQSIAWISINARVVKKENRESIYIEGTHSNITEYKLSEEALRKSEEKFAKAFQSSPDVIILTSLTTGRISEVNDRVQEIFGYTRNEVVGKTTTELQLWVDNSQRDQSVLAIMRDGYVRDWNVKFNTKSGKVLDTLLSGLIIELWDDKFILATIRDITEHKRLEAVLQNTQRLESLGILAGGIAHDFNNLLGAIYGYIDLAKEKCDDDEDTTYISKALATIDRARSLTMQLLTFAKGGAPVKKIEPLVPFIQETTSFALSGSSISCHFDIQDNVWPCNFDRNQIGQVLDNLVINACQAMPDGGTIEVSTRNVMIDKKAHAVLSAGNYVKISIKDHGIGIPRESLNRIFDPFFTTKSKGHGLGLASCYSIIHRHDGCINVESEVGKGSTFHVYLPASSEPAVNFSDNREMQHNGNGTFLVMDDEEVIQQVLHSMLTSLGYTVVCKNNGQEALQYFLEDIKADHAVTGMIFDLTVPGGFGGKEIIEEIRKVDAETPVFVASGYAEDPVIADPQKFGFTASICKPFLKSELMKMLNEHQPKRLINSNFLNLNHSRSHRCQDPDLLL